MSSAMGIISQASAASRQLDKPLGLTDGIMVAYKASKTAVTQSAPRCSTQVAFALAMSLRHTCSGHDLTTARIFKNIILEQPGFGSP